MRLLWARPQRLPSNPQPTNPHHSALGIGLILGAGIFVSTGEAAGAIAGPAVVLSFIVAGISAILSTLCYSEFAVRFPLSGG